jgi:cell division protease FtsH
MIGVDAPNMQGRFKILQVHARGKPIAPGVDLLAVARRTPGFTGADLANVLNEAALLTARQNRKLIDERLLDEAIDRVSMGPQRHSHLMTEQEKLMTAYHEGGHALVAAALPGTDPVAKITILPRGRALGFTQVLPETDKSSISRNDLLNQLAYALGGLAAEQLIFHDPTTGSSSDIEKATGVARKMVTSFGMSERIGAVKLGEDNGEPFLGRDFGHTRNYSEEIAAIIDEEISSLMTNAHQEAFDILVRNRKVLDDLVTQLLERETIDRNGLRAIFAGVAMSAERPAWTGSDNRVPSMIPPVNVPAHVSGGPEPTPEITIGPGTEGGSGPSALPPMAPPSGPPASGPVPPHTPNGGPPAENPPS